MKNSILETDLYQITMAAVYHETKKHEEIVTFEGFVRKLPPQRNFLVFAGLQPLLESLRDWRITGEEIAYLKGLPQFETVSEQFWVYLNNLRFTAEVWAPPEGTVLFENEPFIRVTGRLLECQLVETLVLNILNYSMAVASKAARVRIAAGNKTPLSEFGFRRAPGPDAANLASRAAYIGGFDSTSNTMAGMLYGIPVKGTVAHSFILAHDSEKEAFTNFKQVFSQGTLLIDTYDPLRGTETALKTLGTGLQGARLDSGDKLVLSRDLRRFLDYNGRKDVQIIVSDDMNEHKIKALRLLDAPIDAYGVGTEVVNPGPLGGVYKLVETEHGYKAKLSENKATYPGKKNTNRRINVSGMFVSDTIVFDEESGTNSLLQKVMDGGRVLYSESLDKMKERMYANTQMLPSKFLSLDETYTAPVIISNTLIDMMEEVILKTQKENSNG